MAFDWAGFETGVRAAVGAVWPETLPGPGGGGVWTVTRIERFPLENVTAPFAVIQFSPARDSNEWSGITNQAYEIETSIFYVTAINLSTHVELTVRGRLEDLEDALLATGITPGQVWRVTGQDTSELNAANAILLTKNKALFAGALYVTLIAGETGN